MEFFLVLVTEPQDCAKFWLVWLGGRERGEDKKKVNLYAVSRMHSESLLHSNKQQQVSYNAKYAAQNDPAISQASGRMTLGVG